MKIRSSILAALAAFVSAVASDARAADVAHFFLAKGQEYSQTNATNVISVAAGKPFRFTGERGGDGGELRVVGDAQAAEITVPHADKRLRALGLRSRLHHQVRAGCGLRRGHLQFHPRRPRNDGTNRPALAAAGGQLSAHPAGRELGGVAGRGKIAAAQPRLGRVHRWRIERHDLCGSRRRERHGRGGHARVAHARRAHPARTAPRSCLSAG